jgi:hypothetical protein
MKMKFALLSASCLVALSVVQSQASNILVNGDFSANQGQGKVFFWDATGAPTGSIPDWTPTGPGGAINYDLGGAYVGNSGVDGLPDDSNYGGAAHLWLDSYDPAVYNTSSYTIQPGDNYSLSFNINGEWSPDGNHNTAVSLYYVSGGNRVIFDTYNVNVPINWNYTWTPESFNVAAPSAGVGDPLGVEIQNVTPESGNPVNNDDSYTAYGNVVLSVVPEPTSIALFGLGGLALLAFRRRA